MVVLPPCPDPFNLAAHVLGCAEALTDKIALRIVHGTVSDDWTYGQLSQAVRGAGTGLRALGLQPGDRVILRLGSTPAFPIAFLGCIAAGLVPVPTSDQLSGPEVAHVLTTLHPKALICDDRAGFDVPVTLTSAQVLAMQTLPPCTYDLGDPDRLAYVIFTSGPSSGQPLPVAHAHRAIWARRMMHQGWEGLGAGDRLLHAGAFNWTYTLGTGLLDPWSCGATALIPAKGTDVAALADLASHWRATIFAAAPGIYRRLLHRTLPAMPDLRHGLSAGEALPDPLRQDWRRATGCDLHEALGMTEVSTYLSGAPGRPAPPGTLGYAQPGRRITLLGADGQPVPCDTPGEIAVHLSDPGLMLEYLDHPAETAARKQGDWFLTGDWAQMRSDGACVGLGRQDDLINAGGIRVSPLEVEQALLTFPGITECAVTEVQVAPGARVIAALYTSPQPLDDTALIAHCAGLIAPYKCPRIFCRLAALPRGPNAKLNRRALSLTPCRPAPAPEAPNDPP